MGKGSSKYYTVMYVVTWGDMTFCSPSLVVLVLCYMTRGLQGTGSWDTRFVVLDIAIICRLFSETVLSKLLKHLDQWCLEFPQALSSALTSFWLLARPRPLGFLNAGRDVLLFRSECEAQVKKYPGAVYKGFQEYSSADAFVNESGGYGGRSHVSSARAHVSSAHVSSAHVSSAQVSSARERYSGNFVGGSRTRK